MKAAQEQIAKVKAVMPVQGGVLQRQCACGTHTQGGGECEGCKRERHDLQRKMVIGASNDPLEWEADRVADQVLAASAPSAFSGASPRIQRRKEQAAEQVNIAPESVDRVLASPGRSLDPALQQDMGQRFGYDFSRVRVHADAAAAQSARAVNANAYTVGRDIVFGAGQYAPDTYAGNHLLAHELTHVLQQERVGSRVMRQGPTLPRSLDSTLVPSTLSLAELDQEIAALRAWLQTQQVGTEETERLFRVLEMMQTEKEARTAGSNLGVPSTRPSSSSILPPPRQALTSTPVNSPSPTTTHAGLPLSRLLSLEPSEATRQRLEQIIRQGGPMPADTRVIGALIIEFEGGGSPLERRAISSMATDDLGHAAPVTHAVTPTTRTLSAARGIGGASIRREFPFSHINDAEIKLFEWAADVLRTRPNARGRISFLTMRSRHGGQILEPIPACSSCTNATFQIAGRFRGMQVASYAATHPTAELDLGPTLGVTVSSVAGGAMARTGGSGGTPSSQTQATAGKTRAEIGTPDLRGLNVGGPSPRGEAIGAGITLAFMGANFILNIINDRVQQRRAREALNAIEPGLHSQRQQHPELGILLIFYNTQYQAPEESLIRPGAAFGSVSFYTGRTPNEARDAWHATPTIRAGVGPNTEEFTQQIWIPPVIPPSVTDIRTPFPSAALATFADGQSMLQDVEWGGITGFDDEGTSRLSLGKQLTRFLILRVPNKLHFFNGRFRVEVDIPITLRGAQSGGAIPVVNLDPTIPGFNVSAACIFPADDATDQLFAASIPTRDNLGQLDIYTNFGMVRWVRPENVVVLQRL